MLRNFRAMTVRIEVDTYEGFKRQEMIIKKRTLYV